MNNSSIILNFYHSYIVPHLTKRNKIIGISAAITVSLCYMVRDRMLKPPKNLRHLPYHTHYQILRSILAGESYWDRSYRLTIPHIDSKESNGIYLRPGRNGFEVHVANAQDAKYVLTKTNLFPKADVTSGAEKSLNIRFIGGPNILVLNGQHWKDQRKVMNPSFHRSMPVKVFGGLVVDLFKTMDAMGTDVIEVTDLMTRWTLDAIGKAGFDFDFKAIKENDNQWVHIYNKINEGLQNALYFVFPILDQKLQWLSPKRQQIHRDMDQFIGMIDEIIQTRRDEISRGDWKNKNLEENEKDILSLMIESENRGEGILSNEELMSNILLFFFAGHETTSNALSFAIYYLAKHPDIQEKARAEAVDILGTDPTDILPTLTQTKQMTYINQVMKETLRINGPVIGIVPRIVTQDIVLSGTFIPKGSTITVDIFNILHSEKVFKNATSFDPDRFAKREEQRETDEEEDDITGWIPFGSGARQCIGMNFSLAEQRVMLSMLLRKYVWKLPKESIHKDQVVPKTSAFIIGPEDLQIEFEKRY